jgi:histidinol-phosphate aminotransferase
MPDRPRLTPLAQSLPATVPFVGPETQERQRGRPFRARIGANENGFGASPKVAERMAAVAGEMWKYCDPENHDLKKALAAYHGVAPGNIVVGEGIDGLLGLVVRLMIEPGMPVVTSLGAYPTFNYHVAGFGGRLVAAHLAGADRVEDGRADIAGLLRKLLVALEFLAGQHLARLEGRDRLGLHQFAREPQRPHGDGAVVRRR